MHMERFSPSEVREIRESKLAPEIDCLGTIFAYGSLLDKQNLSELLRKKSSVLTDSDPDKRSEVEIIDVDKQEDIVRLMGSHPGAVFILKGVKMGGMRYFVFPHEELIRRYESKGLKYDELKSRMLVEHGINLEELGDAPFNMSYLINRPAKGDEVEIDVVGGLIIGLRAAELKLLDDWELAPVYERKLVSSIEIKGVKYQPKNITFYQGSSDVEYTPAIKEKNRQILITSREAGELPPTAGWSKGIFSKSNK